MGRPLRNAVGDIVYHVLNRANARRTMFEKYGDFNAFEEILRQAQALFHMRILAYCIMPNHWHLVLWPRCDGELSRFVGWTSLTHTRRWHCHHHTEGTGHLYQGRFKSFPVQADGHFLALCRYVERNPLRAGLALRAEEWRWSSLWHRSCGTPNAAAWLDEWPVPRPADWTTWVNEPQSASELASVRTSVQRNRPLGPEPWMRLTASRLGLDSTLRPRGRPTGKRVLTP